jgi:hypothetical protein
VGGAIARAAGAAQARRRREEGSRSARLRQRCRAAYGSNALQAGGCLHLIYT